MTDEVKYFEAYLKNVIRFYAENAFKDKGWYAVAIDPINDKVVYRRDPWFKENPFGEQ